MRMGDFSMEAKTYQCKKCGENTSNWSAMCNECHDIRIRRTRLIEQYAGQIYAYWNLDGDVSPRDAANKAIKLADAVIAATDSQGGKEGE